MWSLLHGLPSPPYARRNAIIIEMIGRKSGQRYRIPVGSPAGKRQAHRDFRGRAACLVGENAQAKDGQQRVFLHGRWRQARLQLGTGDPELYLRRMNRVHAAFVHTESSAPSVIEIMPES